MGFKKISELDPAVLVNDSDLFAGAQEDNGELDNKKYTAEQLKLYFQNGTQPELTFDDVPVENSNNPVKSGGLYSEFAAKQDAMTFDAMPTDGSSNPVTSDGIEAAIASSEARSIPLSQKGEAGGVAELDSSGKVLSSQLPSYVDDVEEYTSRSAFPVFGEGGKIYIAIDTNLAYRWTGSGYAEISPSLALGETSSTAYRGDRGKTAYDFSQSPYTSAPAMDGAASAGSSSSWARGDHIHPKDTSKQDVLTFDNTPTENSSNPVKSGGVYSALANKQDTLTFDDAPVENSNNPVKSGGLYSKFATKQDALTFDDVPVEDSNNPVKSGGIYGLTSIIAEILNKNAVYATDTASGSPASFQDGADDVPVVDLKVSIEPVQSGSGDPSPTNVRPISGWTGLTLYRSGEDTSDPETLSVSWAAEAGTVYGGTLDVTTGVLTVDRAIIDPATKTIHKTSESESNYLYYIWLSATPSSLHTDLGRPSDVLCSAAPTVEAPLSTAPGVMLSVSNNRTIYISLGALETNTVDGFKAVCSANNVRVVYPIATPTTYQLTPTEVKTLLGDNNIWADTGDVNVEYRADAKLYIDKKLSELSEN